MTSGRSSCSSRLLWSLLILLAVGGCNADEALYAVFEAQRGYGPDEWVLHDPSRMVEIDGKYLMVASTGDEQTFRYGCGLETWYLASGASGWFPGSCLFNDDDKPAWINGILPGNDGAYWAPGLVDSHTLYYTASSGFVNPDTCIGLARATGVAPGLKWSDSGAPIVCTFASESSNDPIPAAIDPSVFEDSAGDRWLLFGGGHIYASKLDPVTGQRLSGLGFVPGDPNDIHLANGPTVASNGNQWIESPFAFEHGGFVYLFVNWYACCAGANSTYQVRVGRAASIQGPFLDASGTDMLAGGGTLILQSSSMQIGPGHPGIFQYEDIHGNERFAFSYHYYEADGTPWATIATRELTWVNDWPQLSGTPWDPNTYWETQ